MSIFFELLLPCFVNLASLYVAGTGNQLWLVSSLRLVGKIPIGGNISMISMSYWSSQPHYRCILDRSICFQTWIVRWQVHVFLCCLWGMMIFVLSSWFFFWDVVFRCFSSWFSWLNPIHWRIIPPMSTRKSSAWLRSQHLSRIWKHAWRNGGRTGSLGCSPGRKPWGFHLPELFVWDLRKLDHLRCFNMEEWRLIIQHCN